MKIKYLSLLLLTLSSLNLISEPLRCSWWHGYKDALDTKNYLDIVNKFMQKGQDFKCCWAFSDALCSGNIDVVKAFINAGFDVKEARTSLFEAFSCCNGNGDKDNPEPFNVLLQHGVKVDSEGTAMRTPLHQAAKDGYVKIMATLIKYGANVNARDRHGNTPLHLAIIHDHPSAIDLLIKNKAEINLRNADGYTPLYVAIQHRRYNNFDTVNMLIAHGADVNAVPKEDYPVYPRMAR